MMKRLFGACIVVSLLASLPAWAVPTLDQLQELQDGGVTATGGPSGRWMGQTFTAGLSGTLDHIDIGNTFGMAVLPAARPYVQIRNTVDGGQPGSSVLATVLLDDSLPTRGWASVDLLSRNISVTAGEMYAIVIYPSVGPGKVTVGSNRDTESYARGALWEYSGGVWQTHFIPGDIQFRTYVDVDVIPAPGALLLGTIGAGFVATLRRRRTL